MTTPIPSSSPASPGFELRGEHGPLSVLLRDLWRARPLVRVLARKEFLVRYRRASFGVAWALALPLLQASILAVILPRFVRFEVEGNYVLFVFAGTTVWSFFSTSLSDGSGAIVNGQDISTRVYFPRMILPLVVIMANLYALVPGVVVLVGASIVLGGAGINSLWLLPGAALAALLTAALAVLLSAMHVYFRDVRYLVQASLMAWFYVTPVFYPIEAVGGLRPWIEANPVTGVVQMFRAGTGDIPFSWTPVAWSAGWSLGLLIVALAVHRRFDRVFVDLL